MFSSISTEHYQFKDAVSSVTPNGNIQRQISSHNNVSARNHAYPDGSRKALSLRPYIHSALRECASGPRSSNFVGTHSVISIIARRERQVSPCCELTGLISPLRLRLVNLTHFYPPDACANVTLRREILEVISYKLPSRNRDDLRWPALTGSNEQLDSLGGRKDGVELSPFDSDDNDDQSEDLLLAEYWASIREKYQQLPFDVADLARSKVDNLPVNWTTVHIYATEDRNTMFVCRQRANQQPLVFSLPLKGRREAEEDEHLTFDDAIAELREIVHLSDVSTKCAINVKGQDQRARAAWWADRMALDKRLQELLESIEFCWFGAFKVCFVSRFS